MSAVENFERIGSAEVASDLRKQIRNHTIEAFSRLPAERVLAARYGVSRGTVREALNRLANEAMVDIRAGSGTYVIWTPRKQQTAAIENARPLELIDARFALEPHICRLAVLHARASDFDRMDLLMDKMDISVGDPVAFSEADTAFHSALVESTGNNLLVWIIGQIKSVRGQNEWQRMRQLTLNSDIIATYNIQHREIVNAIRAREPEAAANLMKDHLETARLSLTRAAET
jgi:GntR family uxuAB operon transcriptional repressor